MHPTKIIIIDDHEIVREGLKNLLLGSAIEVVGDVSSGKELDVLLLDLALRGISGIEILNVLAKHNKGLKTLVLSANDGEDFIVKSVEAGAKGFLPKDCSKQELIKAIQTVHGGDSYFGESVAPHVFSEFVRRVRFPGEQINLTDRELEVLKYFAEGLNYDQTAEKMNVGRRTVEAHKHNLYEKLGFRNDTDLVKYAIKKNIVKL
jgi:DNA-binding NarL/FixJ family response regulator